MSTEPAREPRLSCWKGLAARRVPTLMSAGDTLFRLHRHRRWRVLTPALALVLLVVTAGPGAAHAGLVASDPAAGAALPSAPAEVVLTFSQEVAITAGAVVVADGDGAPVDTDLARHGPGRRDLVIAELPALEEGTYTVSWRVTSADGDPITGSFSFLIAGTPGIPGTAGAVHVPPDPPGSGVPSLAAGTGGGTPLVVDVLRFVGFAAMVLLVGIVLHGLVLAPIASPGRVRSLLWWSALALASSALLGVGVGAAHAGGRGLTAAADPDLVESYLQTTAARAMLVRTVIAAAMVVLVRRSGPSALPGPVGLLGGVALLVTFVVSGHAITGEYVPAALVADLVHLGAAGLWVGGLVSLLVLGGARDPAAVRRFSAVASWAVAALVVSGSFAIWRQLASIEQLVNTDYGRLLLLKLLLVAGALVLGAMSRRAARGLLGGRLRGSMAAEVAIAVVVLGVTAALVGSAPGHSAGGPAEEARVTPRADEA